MVRVNEPLTDGDPRPHLTLASASPRRRQILSDSWTGRLCVSAPRIDEGSPAQGEGAADYAVRTAAAKCSDVAARSAPGAVLAADTVVELDGRILGKPSSGDEARSMLLELRGRDHCVTTGIALTSPSLPHMLLGHETSTVSMRSYSSYEIELYIALGDPLDKAGAYGVQDTGFAPAEKVEGCYLNVVGLPLCRLSMLAETSLPNVSALLQLDRCVECLAPAAPGREAAR